MTILKRLFLILLAAAAFGAAMAVLKGNGSGIRDDIGNLSAPWLLLPFAAGAALRGGVLAGAAAGLAGTFAALAAFNLANAFVLDLGPHSTVASIQLTFTVYWFWRGLLSGPLFGALGAVWRARGMPAWGLAVILLLDADANRSGGETGLSGALFHYNHPPYSPYVAYLVQAQDEQGRWIQSFGSAPPSGEGTGTSDSKYDHAQTCGVLIACTAHG